MKIFVMGKNEWRDEDDWPLARAKSTRYYLHSTGAANRRGGKRHAEHAAPGEEKADQYVYDPNDAVPTIGGPLCCGALPTGIGPQDQRPAEARGDVLVFTTPAFAKDTEVTGPVSLDLYVSSSAVDTDFTGNARGRMAERICAKLDERDSANALPEFAGEAGAGESGRDVSHHVWICGPRAMSFWPGTNCGWRFPAATFRGLTAT